MTLTTALLIAPHPQAHNAQELIAAASFKSKRDVEHLVAEQFPKPDVADVVRKLPVRQVQVPPAAHSHALLDAVDTSCVSDAADVVGTETAEQVRAPEPAAIPSVTQPVGLPRRAIVAPLSSARYKVQFTADQDTHDNLRHAQALLRHQIPSGDIAAIVSKALTLLIADVEKKTLAIVARPRTKTNTRMNAATHKHGLAAAASKSRHIPAHVRRAVWARDRGRCAFTGADGRCAERGRLEYHHLVPFAAGGLATVDNIQLRCRAHNAHEAVVYFGELAWQA